jgi:multidrug resistance efflux pump
MMPNLLANIARGADWADRGVMTSSGDALIPKKDVTMRQILARMAGWTPLEVRKEQTLNNIRKQASYLAKDNDNINQRLGEAQALKKWDKVRELEAEARKEDIKINRTQVRKYRDATLGRKNMTIDNAPKKIRREIQDWENLFK